MDIKKYEPEVYYDNNCMMFQPRMHSYTNGRYVLYEDIKHLLEQSDNSDYTKCLDDLCEKEIPSDPIAKRFYFECTLKKHFT